MKTKQLLFFVTLLLLPVIANAQDDDLLNSLDIEGINLLGYPKWDIGLTAGIAYRVEPTPSGTIREVRTHTKALKSAIAWGGSAYYFMREGVGLGLTYSHFSKSSGMNFDDDRNPLFEPLYVENEKLITDYYGTSVYFRQSSNSEKMYYGPVLGLGYLRYKDELTAKDNQYFETNVNNINNEDFTAGTLAFQVGLKVQAKISESLALGVRMDILLGMSGIEGYWQQRESDNAQKESLSRFEFGLALHYLKH